MIAVTFHDPYPELAPFAVDTWPRCQPWERRGVITFADETAIRAWAVAAQLALTLAIDQRFDSLLGWVDAAAWRGVELADVAGIRDPGPDRPGGDHRPGRGFDSPPDLTWGDMR